MSYEKELQRAREFDRFRLKLKVLKEDIEANFYDPVFGKLDYAVADELRLLMKHFGL